MFGLVAAVLLTAGIVFAASGAGSTPVRSASSSPHAARVALRTVVSGLSSPVALAWRRGDNSTMYVAEQGGSVVRVRGGHVVSTALHVVNLSSGGERGLLGLAFSVDGKKMYVDYTGPNGDINVVEFTMKGGAANTATRRQVLLIAHHKFPNHNGGNLVMAPDNTLYIGTGDGGGGGDTLGNAQRTDVLLGKILRIDPRASRFGPYRIPGSNPFVGKPGKRGEIWMYGLRNPWRFSFDRKTRDLWIGDVGQDSYEEVDYAAAGGRGINWGWNRREGFHAYNGGAEPPGARDPILERPHSAGDCAIIGGYVYRGASSVPLVGRYVFGDECTGELREASQSGGKLLQETDLHLNVSSLSSFGEGPGGGIYAVSLTGVIYQLVGA